VGLVCMPQIAIRDCQPVDNVCSSLFVFEKAAQTNKKNPRELAFAIFLICEDLLSVGLALSDRPSRTQAQASTVGLIVITSAVTEWSL